LLLSFGKLPYTELREILSVIYRKDPSVLLGPGIGEDAALIELGDDVLVVHADPITGAVENIGWLSVHVSANDIATRGVRPRWLVTVLLLPPGLEYKMIKGIVQQIRNAADEIGAVVVGGHTEITPGIDRPIVITTAIGIGKREKVIYTANARPGDFLVLTKGAGIEGTAIIASEFQHILKGKVSEEILLKAREFIREISVVREALAAFETGGVHAMHDATEGGVIGAVQEISIASGLSARVYEGKVPIREETLTICRILGLDPLRLISSGSLLLAVDPGKVEDVLKTISSLGIEVSIIGSLGEGRGVTLIRRNGEEEEILKPIEDELWRLLALEGTSRVKSLES